MQANIYPGQPKPVPTIEDLEYQVPSVQARERQRDIILKIYTYRLVFMCLACLFAVVVAAVISAVVFSIF